MHGINCRSKYSNTLPILPLMKNQNFVLLGLGRATFSLNRRGAFLSWLHTLCDVRPIANADKIYRHNRTISGLLKSGSVDAAVQVFDEMPQRDVVTWNIMISGLYRCGSKKQSLRLYSQMVSQNISENPSTFSTVLSMCSCAGFFEQGLIVHCRALVLGISTNVYIGSALVDLYLRMGLTDIALRLFSTLQERNLATWNVVLRGLFEVGRSKDLLRFYNGMKSDGLEPNGLTFCYLIQGCGYKKVLDEGTQLHCLVIKNGWVDSNLFVANALVDFYSACGDLTAARKSFEVIPAEEVISWNSMVSVCTSNGCLSDALGIFWRMQFWGKRPSTCSFLGFLKLSASTVNMSLGKIIHCSLLKSGFLDVALVRSTLIDMYGKCGDIESSVGVFYSVPDLTTECCNPLMTSLLRSGFTDDVINLFNLMVDETVGYDETTLSSTVKALLISLPSSSACFSLLHGCAVKSGFDSDSAVVSSLIDAYSKSGQLESSLRLFHQFRSPSVVCFTSLIGALARNGKGKESLHVFDELLRSGLMPDKVTFLSLLMGCSHSGLVEEGKLIFQSMETHYGLCPDRRHYWCMVDLLGRAGLLEEAERLVRGNPWRGDYVIWSSVLRSCRLYSDEGVGKRAARMLMEIEPENASSWLQASSFYSSVGEFESMKKCREMAMVARGADREIGRSSIEVRGG